MILTGVLSTVRVLPYLLVGGILYIFAVLVEAAAFIGSGVLAMMSAKQLKEVNPQFFDTYVLGMLLLAACNIVASLFLTLSLWGTGNLISTIIWQAVSIIIGFCLAVMYFSKSERVRVYFGERPLPKSKFWSTIQQLPTFLTDATPVNFTGPSAADTSETANQNYTVPTAQPTPQQPAQSESFPVAEEPQEPTTPQE